MRGKISIVSGMFFLLLFFGGIGKVQATPNIYTGFLRLWLNQHALGAVPNQNAAFFKFFNQENNNPVARAITLRDAFEGDGVELAPGEDAFASAAWIMFITDHCERQDVRQVIDVDSPQCQVPGDADPDTTLNAILSLPAACLGPKLDACQLFDSDLRVDFASSMAKARQTLKNEIDIKVLLDGEALDIFQSTAPARFAISATPVSQPDPDFICAQDLHYAPIYAYFFYGYRIPIPQGKCMVKGVTAPVTPLEPGAHQLEFNYSLPEDVPGGGPQSYPVSIFQNSP